MSKRRKGEYSIAVPNITKPVIGVVDGYSVGNVISITGGHAVDIDTIEEAEAVLPFLDGILLTGGSDINPELYGVEFNDIHQEVYGISDTRDKMELAILAYAMKHNLAIMGICRGSQMINVAHGGTLHQHLDELNGHSHWGIQHDVKLSRSSMLATNIGTTSLSKVSSYHHQSIDRIGNGLRPIGWYHDGTVEAVETLPNQSHYALGVQFHPEMDYRTDKDAVLIFKHFLRMARKRGGDNSEQRYSLACEAITPLRKSYSFSTGMYIEHGGVIGNSTYDKWGDGSYQGAAKSGSSGRYAVDCDYDDEPQHDWWDDLGWIGEGVEDDSIAYEEWKRINAHGLSTYNSQEQCDAGCAFPPCSRPGECDVDEGDCFAMRIAESIGDGRATSSPRSGSTSKETVDAAWRAVQREKAGLKDASQDDMQRQVLDYKRGNPRGGSK